MNIAVFGGSFNPPHLGHLHLVQSVIESLKIDKMLIMPVKTPPHKAADEMAGEHHRLNMCRLAFLKISGCEISDMEIKSEGKSYTVLTMRKLKELYPDDNLFFVMGSDMLLTFKQWFEWQEILSLCTLICISRCDEDTDKSSKAALELESCNGRCILLRDEPLEVSSTEIRKKAADNENLSCYLPANVIEYINENSLYKKMVRADNVFSKMSIDEIKEYLEKNLSKKRYQHTLNVAAEAVKLAKEYGLDRERCCLAALLHDCCKEMPFGSQKELALKWNDVSDIEINSTPLLHSIAGAQYAREFFGVEDTLILNAIRRHTAAGSNMTDIDKCVYLADLISDDRDYKDVKKMRKVCYESLDKGLLEALKFSISDCIRKENTIPQCTIDAYNRLIIDNK